MVQNRKDPIQKLLVHCGNLQPRERLLILCDAKTKELGERFAEEATEMQATVNLMEVNTLTKAGQEPPEEVVAQMVESDLIMSLCSFSLAHSQARISASEKGARFLSMPDYSWDLLSDESLMVDFHKQAPTVTKVAELLSNGDRVHVKSAKGTDITLHITGRTGNNCPGFTQKAGDLGSPPDIEANVSPLETLSNGTVVVDGSITMPEIGLLTSPVTLTVKEGRITTIESSNSDYVKILTTIFEDKDSKRRVLAECGIGLNPKAQLTGIMLTDEGTLGTVHFGFGSNFSVGGQNQVDFHLDFVLKDISVWVDDRQLFSEGKLLI